MAFRELDEACALIAMADEVLTDVRTGSNIRHGLTALLAKLIKTGAKVVRHARYVPFQLAEAAIMGRIRQWTTEARAGPAAVPTLHTQGHPI